MKHLIFLASFALFSSTFFFCKNSDNNPVDPKRPGIQIVTENGIKKDTITGYANSVIDIMVSVLSADELDSVIWHTENGFSGSISQVELSGSLSIRYTFTAQCTTSLMVTGLKNNLVVTSDTAALLVSEPLAVKIKPFRLYASPNLPCTLKALVNNRYPWQQLTLVPQITSDSFLIWSPTENDIGRKVQITLIAIDNRMTSATAKDSVCISVIADNELLPPPANLRLDRRRDNIVKISWDIDPLADSYILYRKDPDVDSTWEAIALPVTYYIDLTEKALMYRVSSINYFGASIPSGMIYVSDTVHYAHRIFFPDSFSTVSEAIASHFIKLQVATPAVNEITVWCSLSGDSDIPTDFGASVYQVRIAPGDTLGLCTLSIIDDNLSETSKIFSISIDSTTHGFINGQNVHQVLLSDDDSVFSVTYDANGADAGNVPVDFRRYVKNDVVVVMGNSENLVKANLNFAGWKKNSIDTNGKLYNPGDTLIIDMAGIRLYAQWKTAPPVITTHPQDSTVRAGNIFFLTVQASGIDLSYQWQKNRVDITGAVSDTFFIDTVTRYDSGSYRCIVTNAGGIAISNSSFLNVISVATVSAGGPHTLILMEDGTAWATGLYPYTQVSIVSNDTVNIPVKIMSDVASVYAGINFSFLLITNGDLVRIDENGPVTFASGVASVSFSRQRETGMLLRKDGSLWGWGWNRSGQLGIGIKSDSSELFKVAEEVSYVNVGQCHSMMIKNGILYAAGDNFAGQFGNGTGTDTTYFIKIEEDVSSACIGDLHTFMIKDGNLYATGNNQCGQLGNGTFDRILSFTQITSMVSSVSAGLYHTMIIKDNGSLYGAGSNTFGQLGIGTISESEPSIIFVMSDVSSVSANYSHTMMIKKDGTLWATGLNKYGQLGIGTYENVAKPVLVKF